MQPLLNQSCIVILLSSLPDIYELPRKSSSLMGASKHYQIKNIKKLTKNSVLQSKKASYNTENCKTFWSQFFEKYESRIEFLTQTSLNMESLGKIFSIDTKFIEIHEGRGNLVGTQFFGGILVKPLYIFNFARFYSTKL